MTDFISADSVFKALFDGGYVDRFDWKDINLQTTKYKRSFFCKKCNPQGCHTFEIVVKDGEHLISATSVKYFLQFHKINSRG